uniref:Ig-like domain-containing protein n=1 Tax=Globodera rostochiensis TaxID=31243 RepID=A0A914HBL0_GLORO
MALSNSSNEWFFALFLGAVLFLLPLIDAEQPKRDARFVLRPNSSRTIRQRLSRDTILPCEFMSNSSIADGVEWWYRGFGHVLIGSFDPRGLVAQTNWTRDGAYKVLDNGTLLIRDARRALVERYYCVVFPELLVYEIYFRLDFSFWYAREPGSLFFGSCIVAVVFCAASFLLNIVWIICRHIILWWIKRTERMSRVRALIVALEKYRHKQMESLHETYNRRVSAIRDNYHSQVDQLRHSYTDSADRFRDYRQAQMDNVQQHLDSIRDNYCQQINRLREFGSRRVEQIWEGYDRSITALRTFTMEQRLRMLNQYQVKQRYVNKLLEAIAVETNVEIISRKEAAIREALGEEDHHTWLYPPPSSSCVSITRSASYYSLPEFSLGEEDWDVTMKGPVEGKAGAGVEEDSQWQCTTLTASARMTRVRFAEESTSLHGAAVVGGREMLEEDNADS